ncbi:MAG: glycosyltransferase family 2 protein [Chloroflexota bacterium]
MQIPTDDPQAALLFCRQLHRFLQDAVDDLSVAHSLAPELSIVIPIFNEQENIPVLYERLVAVLCEEVFEVVFVDDGSRDDSLDILQALAQKDSRITVVALARNFGHQVAISAGLDFARGKAVIVMDADLQDPPEVLPQFISKWHEGHDVVYAVREKRKEHWAKRAMYKFFYRLLQRVANIEIPLDAGDFCIMDRRVVDLLVGMPERNRFVRGIRSWVGLDQVGLAYERQARYAGEPKYTFRRLIYLALDGLISFSYLPLRMISVLGFVISAVSLILAIVYIIQKLTVGLNPPGFATLIVSVLFFSGIQLMTIGVIGEYVGRIFDEVKHRPLYVVQRIIKGNAR